MSRFGHPLPKEGPTPDVFMLSLNHLELHALEVEGIFRISGQKARIEEIKSEFERGVRFEFTEKDDIHDVSGTFRMWLQQLPEPIIPYEFYSKMVECGKLDKKKGRAALKALVDELPPLRRSMLQQLIRLLRLLSLYHETNKMTASNLAVVMGPNICRPQSMASTMEALTEAQCVTNATILLIDDYEFILPREPPSEDTHLTKVKRSSRVLIDPLVSVSITDMERSPSDNKVGPKEAEDAIDSKLSLSLSDIKPDQLLAPPKSARSAPRSRSRGSSATPRNRGFSNALEWLVTSVQEDVLDDQIIIEEETALSPTTAAAGSESGASESSSQPTTPRGDLTQSFSSSSRKRSSKKSKTHSDASPTVDVESSISDTSTITVPKKERSKKLKSESSTNSTTSSTSEPPSPREKSTLGDSVKSNSSTSSATSSSGKKKSKTKLTLGSEATEHEDAPKSPRRKIAPPSREGSLKTEDF
jgi:hypothetical protein